MDVDQFSKAKKAKLDAEAREKRAKIAKRKAEELQKLTTLFQEEEKSHEL